MPPCMRRGGELIWARAIDYPRWTTRFSCTTCAWRSLATERPMVCSHHAGDWFAVEGENLRFPDGQAFSLYALAALLPLLPAKQRVTDDNDWMTTDTDIACPDPQLRRTLPNHAHRPSDVPAQRGDGRAAAAARDHAVTARVPRVALAPGYDISRLLKGGWQLAGGHGAVDREARARRHGRRSSRGHHHVRLRGHLHRRRGVDRCVSGARARPRRRGRRATPCRCTPSACPDLRSAVAADPGATSRRPSLDRVSASGWTRSISCSCTGGTTRLPACSTRRAWLDDLRREGSSGTSGSRTSISPTSAPSSRPACLSSRTRCSTRCSITGPRATWRALCGTHGIGLLAYGAWRAGSSPSDGSANRAPREPLENRSLVKYRLIIDECGGWDYLQALLDALRTHRGQAARRHRRRGDALGARISQAVVGRHRRRPPRRPPRRHAGGAVASTLDDEDRARIARRAGLGVGAHRRRVRARAREGRPPRVDHALQPAAAMMRRRAIVLAMVLLLGRTPVALAQETAAGGGRGGRTAGLRCGGLARQPHARRDMAVLRIAVARGGPRLHVLGQPGGPLAAGARAALRPATAASRTCAWSSCRRTRSGRADSGQGPSTSPRPACPTATRCSSRR